MQAALASLSLAPLPPLHVQQIQQQQQQQQQQLQLHQEQHQQQQQLTHQPQCDEDLIRNLKLVTASERNVIFACYALTFLLGTIGNSLVILALIRNKLMRKEPTNLFILNLALSDILRCFFAVPFTPLYLLNDQEWIFGAISCKLVSSAQVVSACVSSFTLAIISVHRYLLIVRPLKKQLSLSNCRALNWTVWTLGIIVSSPYVTAISVVMPDDECPHKYCVEDWTSPAARFLFGLLCTIVQFLLPNSVISYCYVAVFLNLARRHKARTRRLSLNSINAAAAAKSAANAVANAAAAGAAVGGCGGTVATVGQAPNATAAAAAAAVAAVVNAGGVVNSADNDPTTPSNFHSQETTALATPAATTSMPMPMTMATASPSTPKTVNKLEFGNLSFVDETDDCFVKELINNNNNSKGNVINNFFALDNDLRQTDQRRRAPSFNAHLKSINNGRHMTSAAVAAATAATTATVDCSLASFAGRMASVEHSRAIATSSAAISDVADTAQVAVELGGSAVALNDRLALSDYDLRVMSGFELAALERLRNGQVAMQVSLSSDSAANGKLSQCPTNNNNNNSTNDCYNDNQNVNDNDDIFKRRQLNDLNCNNNNKFGDDDDENDDDDYYDDRADNCTIVQLSSKKASASEQLDAQRRFVVSCVPEFGLSSGVANCDNNKAARFAVAVGGGSTPLIGDKAFDGKSQSLVEFSLSANKRNPDNNNSNKEGKQVEQQLHHFSIATNKSCANDKCAPTTQFQTTTATKKRINNARAFESSAASSKLLVGGLARARFRFNWIRRERLARDLSAFSAWRDEQRDKRARKTNIMLILMVCMYNISWLPLTIHNFIQDYGDSEIRNDVFGFPVFIVVHTIACFSVIYNPILYAFMSENFRTEFKKIVNNFCSKIATKFPTNKSNKFNKTNNNNNENLKLSCNNNSNKKSSFKFNQRKLRIAKCQSTTISATTIDSRKQQQQQQQQQLDACFARKNEHLFATNNNETNSDANSSNKSPQTNCNFAECLINNFNCHSC